MLVLPCSSTFASSRFSGRRGPTQNQLLRLRAMSLASVSDCDSTQ